VTLGPWPVLVTEGIDPLGRVERWTWEDLQLELTHFHLAKSKLDAWGWLPVRMRDGETRRKAAHVAAVWALVVDLDEDVASFAELVAKAAALGVVCVLHTTWSHRPDRPKARAVFPLAEECPADRWLEVWTAAQRWAASWGATVDAACKDPARLYFLPAIAEDEDRRIVMNEERDAEVIEWSWDGDTPARLPCLSWRWLLAYHSPPPPPRPKRKAERCAGAGGNPRDFSRLQIRRRAWLLVALEAKAAELAAKGSGSRNQAAYYGGRIAAQMAKTGAITRGEVRAAMLEAALACGLGEREAARAIDNGMSKGEEDEPWPIPI